MNWRMRKMPRPLVRRMFSGARGRGAGSDRSPVPGRARRRQLRGVRGRCRRELNRDSPRRVAVAVNDGVGDAFAHGHAEPVHRFIIEPGRLSNVIGHELHEIEHLDGAGNFQANRAGTALGMEGHQESALFRYVAQHERGDVVVLRGARDEAADRRKQAIEQLGRRRCRFASRQARTRPSPNSSPAGLSASVTPSVYMTSTSPGSVRASPDRRPPGEHPENQSTGLQQLHAVAPDEYRRIVARVAIRQASVLCQRAIHAGGKSRTNGPVNQAFVHGGHQRGRRTPPC